VDRPAREMINSHVHGIPASSASRPGAHFAYRPRPGPWSRLATCPQPAVRVTSADVAACYGSRMLSSAYHAAYRPGGPTTWRQESPGPVTHLGVAWLTGWTGRQFFPSLGRLTCLRGHLPPDGWMAYQPGEPTPWRKLSTHPRRSSPSQPHRVPWTGKGTGCGRSVRTNLSSATTVLPAPGSAENGGTILCVGGSRLPLHPVHRHVGAKPLPPRFPRVAHTAGGPALVDRQEILFSLEQHQRPPAGWRTTRHNNSLAAFYSLPCGAAVRRFGFAGRWNPVRRPRASKEQRKKGNKKKKQKSGRAFPGKPKTPNLGHRHPRPRTGGVKNPARRPVTVPCLPFTPLARPCRPPRICGPATRY